MDNNTIFFRGTNSTVAPPHITKPLNECDVVILMFSDPYVKIIDEKDLEKEFEILIPNISTRLFVEKPKHSKEFRWTFKEFKDTQYSIAYVLTINRTATKKIIAYVLCDDFGVVKDITVWSY